jgi:hypothetical protein
VRLTRVLEDVQEVAFGWGIVLPLCSWYSRVSDQVRGNEIRMTEIDQLLLLRVSRLGICCAPFLI